VYANPFGVGNVLHPGTGSGPIPSFPTALGATVQGHPLGGGGRRIRPTAAFGYPVFVGAVPSYYGEPDYAPQPQQQQPPVNVTIVNPPPQTPTVIINQNYGPQATPETDSHVFQAPSGPANYTQPSEQKYSLIAFKDHSVYSASAYWIEGKTMHYVTPQGTHNQASLDLVDLDFTNKLNQK
jgi:hypothetical protein